MDRLKSVVSRAKSLRVPGLNNDEDRDGTTSRERARSASLLSRWHSSSSRGSEGGGQITVNQIINGHVSTDSNTEFRSQWVGGQQSDSDQKNMIYVTNQGPTEISPDLSRANDLGRRRPLLPESAPQFQLDEEEMFGYEDANPCAKCLELTVLSILKGKKTYMSPLGTKHHDTAAALQEAAGSGCKLCQMMADAMVSKITHVAAKDAFMQKWSISAVYFSPSPAEQNFYGPLTVETCVPFGNMNIMTQVLSDCRLGFYTDRGTPAAAYIPGRRLSRKADVETICYEVKRWMKNDMTDGGPITVLPKRLLDVRHGAVKLRQVSPEESSGIGQYICLSHRWSAALRLMTTTLSTLEERLQGINFDDLTQTFKDAITITRKLDRSYIWIDSLCIIQDSVEDWEEESAKMGLYYGSSWLTIGAGMEGDGLFLARLKPPEPYIRLRMPLTEDDPVPSDVFFSTTPHDLPLRGINALTQSPLYSRGWTLQEEMLSARFLSFEPTQVYYRGASDIEYETGYRFKVNKWKGFGQQHLNSKDLWVRIVEDFSTRTLSVASDKLPALSGLAHEYQKIWKDTYLAGLWHSDLWKQLLWYSDAPQKPDMYRAPTWSWASIDGPINFAGTRFSNSCITLIGALIEPKGKNALGQVKGGILTIQATVLELDVEVTNSDEQGKHYMISENISYRLDEQIPVASKVFFVYISENMGLFLLPLPSARSTFRRVAFCRNMRPVDTAVPKTIISIV